MGSTASSGIVQPLGPLEDSAPIPGAVAGKVLHARGRCAKVVPDMSEIRFTLEEANALLPWLEERFSRMVPVRDELAARQGDLLELLRLRRGNGSASKEEDIAAAQRDADRLTQRLQRDLREIAGRGIIVQDLGRGLVDFPSDREGREVYLCWLRGEDQVGHWHETDAGFAGRQRL